LHSATLHRGRARADQLLEDGDWRGAVTWHRILNAIERLQAKAPAEVKRCIEWSGVRCGLEVSNIEQRVALRLPTVTIGGGLFAQS
jgi:hypothetical protein